MKPTTKKELWRTIKFTLFSISAGVIQAGSYALFLYVCRFSPALSHVLSLVLSVLWNFTLNRKYTFQSAANVPIAMLKVALFYLVFTPLSALWTNLLAPKGCSSLVALAVEAGTILINFVTEFLYQRFFVFRKSLDTAKKN